MACDHRRSPFENRHEVWHERIVHGGMEHVQELLPADLVPVRQIRLLVRIPFIVEKHASLIPEELAAR